MNNESASRNSAEIKEWLAKERSHYDCEDCWYSCATLCCDDRRKSTECDCGADEENAMRKAIAAALSERGLSTDPYECHPTKGQCKCGQHEVPAGCDSVKWYWQQHARGLCTLELPNLKCWCGRLRSEHIDGHDPKAPRPSERKEP